MLFLSYSQVKLKHIRQFFPVAGSYHFRFALPEGLKGSCKQLVYACTHRNAHVLENGKVVANYPRFPIDSLSHHYPFAVNILRDDGTEGREGEGRRYDRQIALGYNSQPNVQYLSQLSNHISGTMLGLT